MPPFPLVSFAAVIKQSIIRKNKPGKSSSPERHRETEKNRELNR